MLSRIRTEFLDQYYLRPNKVKEMQKYYQSGKLPVFLKGPADISIYKTMMWSVSLALVWCGVELGRMALGTKKRKP